MSFNIVRRQITPLLIRRPLINSSSSFQQQQQLKLLRTRNISTEFSSISKNGKRPKGELPVRLIVFIVLGICGVTTSYYSYLYYQSFETWPKEVRDDLRRAVKAKIQQGNLKVSQKEFEKALEKSKNLPLERFGKDGLLKISGISISLGSIFEEIGDFEKAYEVYNESLEFMKNNSKTLQEKLRTIALAQRCGDLGNEILKNDEIIEEHLRWSVEELLRLSISEETRNSILTGEISSSFNSITDLNLPNWVNNSNFTPCLESLGKFYAKKGKASFAIPLYIQSIELLMPSDKFKRKKNPTIFERCRTGILMNNIAQLLVDSEEFDFLKNKNKNIDDAINWALKGLDIVEFSIKNMQWDKNSSLLLNKNENEKDKRTLQVKSQCLTTEIALLFNLGELARLKGDNCKAKEFFQKSYLKSDKIGLRESRSRSASALSELEK